MDSDVVLPSNGVLKKWTNFYGGWQDRYFEIVGGNLVYYKSKVDKSYGCRGSISLKNAAVSAHDFDECEFTVSMGTDVIWYMKAENAQSKLLWMRSLVRESNDSDYSSTSTKSHSRNPSLSSVLLTNEKDDDNGRLFTSRIAELEAYRTMCRDQMVSIERLLEQNSEILSQSTLLSVKATHLALLVNVNHIIELIKTGKAVIPEGQQAPLHKISINSSIVMTPTSANHSPLSSEPPALSDSESICTRREVASSYASDDTGTSTIKADNDTVSEIDEFYDADEFDSSVSTAEEASEDRANTPTGSIKEALEKAVEKNIFRPDTSKMAIGHYDDLEMAAGHNLFDLVDKLATEQLKYALAGVEDNVWTLFAEDGAMRMYTREIEDDGGLPVDPLKAVHQVEGVTALEFMHYFFDARYKMQWDHTLDAMSIVENIARDTVVLHQKHKTVWPAASRESLFVSHIRRVDELKREGAHDLYIVCNRDVDRPDVPKGSSSAVRVGLTVSMICETIVKRPQEKRQLTRDDVSCNIIYVSQVHPGGWVPTAALRHVYKKEYPKFLRTFTDYVLKNVKGKPVAI